MAADKNGDGKLNADEFPSRTSKPFSYYDSNKDGYVSSAELKDGLKRRNSDSRR